MKNVTRHIGTLTLTSCLPQSRNGNPRYALTINGVSCRTAPDSNLGFKVRSLDGKRVEAQIGTYYDIATLAAAKLIQE